ncbi:MAG: sulfatase-like hydrolase/transferase [Pirellulales bacterium]|nr:sulfatase-like hydrolase/transferase [Pirellulales bacterium]
MRVCSFLVPFLPVLLFALAGVDLGRALAGEQNLNSNAGQSAAPRGYEIPTIDLSGDTHRQVIVDRESRQYLGHPTTLLLEDGKTILCVYPKGHGRGAIVYKRSADGGLTWSERLPTPASWTTSQEVPTLHRVVDAAGQRRVIMFSGLYPVRMARSDDDGLTWSELEPVGDWGGIVTMGCVIELKSAPGHYLALFHDDGRFFRAGGKKTPTMTLYQSLSTDGGLTWAEPQAIFASDEVHLCEPGAFRSPDGKQLAVLLRENRRQRNSHVIFSNDEGKTWTEPRELPGALTGDRHTGQYAPDGRLFISFRDTTLESPTAGDWVAWVGTYDDIIAGREGQYRVRLMKNHRGRDCAYPGVELLPDGTLVTTTYGHWTAGEEPYIVSVRLKLAELDEKAAVRKAEKASEPQRDSAQTVPVTNSVREVESAPNQTNPSTTEKSAADNSSSADTTTTKSAPAGASSNEPAFQPARVSAKRHRRPNILFILTDDQRADTIHAVGNRHIRTPTLDRLVEQGQVFRRAYCMGSTMPAVCLPSRSMLMTSRTLFHLPDAKSPASVAAAPLLPRTLTAAGFDTLRTGKVGNHPAYADAAFGRNHNVERSATCTTTHADTAIRFLREDRGEQPFFLYVALASPHDPRVAPQPYMDQYSPRDVELPANYLPQHPFDNGEMTIRDEQLAPWPRTREVIAEHLADYYSVITYLDAEIARILATLEEVGAKDDTYVLFSSDHGLAIGSHGLMGKQNLYEHSMRVPLVISGPGVSAGSSNDALVYLHDLFPTICELTGVPIPAGVEGKSLVPVLRDPQHRVRDSLFTAYRDVQRAMCDDRWKLIRYPQVDRTQLFDLEHDPDERNDLAADPRYQDRVARMMARLAAWQRELDDPAPLQVEHPRDPTFTPPAQTSQRAPGRPRLAPIAMVSDTRDPPFGLRSEVAVSATP